MWVELALVRAPTSEGEKEREKESERVRESERKRTIITFNQCPALALSVSPFCSLLSAGRRGRVSSTLEVL